MPFCAAVSLAAVDVRHARRVLELIVKVLAASHMWRPWFAHALDQQVALFISRTLPIYPQPSRAKPSR
jgi:hypothetical protein